MAKTKRATWFKMFGHQRPVIESVSDADAGSGLKAAFRYFDGEEIDVSELSPAAFTTFCVIRPYIDEARRDYEASVKNGRDGGNKRWKKGDSPPIPPHSPPIGVPTEAEAEAEGNTLSSETDASSEGKGKKAKQPFPHDSTPYKAAAALSRAVMQRYPESKPHTERDLQNWADAFEKCNRIDGHDWELISEVLRFSQNDPFWRKNIRSGGTFRKQFDTLYARMIEEGGREK